MCTKKIVAFYFLIIFCCNAILAQQETIITGRVTESGTNGGIPFANIYFRGTLGGTVTDFEGNYKLQTDKATDSIFVKLIGYKSKAKAVKKGTTQVINFQLSTEALNLNMIEVRPGVNPALRIIKNASRNKSKYNRDNLESVQYTSYTKQEADINNISKRIRRMKLFHGLTELWGRMDTLAGVDSKANLPVFMSEIVSDVYAYKEGDKKHEDVNAEIIKFVGMKDGSAASQLQGTDFQNYNFCLDNINIPVLNKDFLSPLADNASLFYNYILMDSVVIEGKRCFVVNCHPKNKRDLAFTGTLWITDTTFAIKQLDLEITKDVNVNVIDHIRIQQVMIPTETDVWVPSQTRVLIDFATQVKKLVTLVIKTYNCNKNYIINKPKDKEFYKTRIKYAEDVVIKDSTYWVTHRDEPLTSLEKESYNMIDTVRNIPFIKFMFNNLYFLFSGYKDVGPVDFGHYMGLYAYNQYEGSRVQLGFRTNAKMSKNWIIRGYGAYGFKDQGFKYDLQLERIISRYPNPYSMAGIQYRDDISQIGTSYNYINNMSFYQGGNNGLYNFSSNISTLLMLVRQQESRIWYQRVFNSGITGTVTFQNIRTSPLFPVYFGDAFTIFQQRNYSITEALLEGRFAPGEHYIQNGNDRIRMGTKKSIVFDFTYTLGMKNILGGDFNYHKISGSITNKFKMSTLGFSKIYLKVGKVFSEIPYTLLEIPRGNQTPFVADNTFNIMNLNEFVCDQYIEAYWHHHFNGLLFNRVPLLKKLEWREVVGINMAYGNLSEKNKIFNQNNNFTVMEDVPYFEADLGVENIFDIIRFDFLYRLTYNDDFYITNYERANPGNKISNWGLKIGLQFSF